MTDRSELHFIKTVAKRLARAKRIAHSSALDLVANELGQPHWRALTIAFDIGWRLSPPQRDHLQDLLVAANPSVRPVTGPKPNLELDQVYEERGSIDSHTYLLVIDFEGVLMQGRGWAISVGEAPSEKPQVEVTDRRIKSNPISDAEFVSKALAIANTAAEKLRARIASDWPRRSTKPDAEGRALHPLHSELSNRWHCLHCDGAFTGEQMAANMWHCPTCSATPIDIFADRFWEAPSK